jgi:hypothetical protein
MMHFTANVPSNAPHALCADAPDRIHAYQLGDVARWQSGKLRGFIG